LEEGKVNNLLTVETPAGLHLTLVIFSLRRRNQQLEEGQVSNLLTEELQGRDGYLGNLQLNEGQVSNLLTEETPAGWRWLPW
jgi:hypothetical protein